MHILLKCQAKTPGDTAQTTTTIILREIPAMTYAMCSEVQRAAIITAVLLNLLLLKVHQTAIIALAIVTVVAVQLHREENFK